MPIELTYRWPVNPYSGTEEPGAALPKGRKSRPQARSTGPAPERKAHLEQHEGAKTRREKPKWPSPVSLQSGGGCRTRTGAAWGRVGHLVARDHGPRETDLDAAQPARPQPLEVLGDQVALLAPLHHLGEPSRRVVTHRGDGGG